MPVGHEQREQILLFNWIRRHKTIVDLCFSIPNERKTSKYTGMLLKQMGLRPGTSDIFIAVPRGIFHGLFIELKYGKNKPTPHQTKFLLDMQSQGYDAKCIWGYENAKNYIINYLGDFL